MSENVLPLEGFKIEATGTVRDPSAAEVMAECRVLDARITQAIQHVETQVQLLTSAVTSMQDHIRPILRGHEERLGATDRMLAGIEARLTALEQRPVVAAPEVTKPPAWVRPVPAQANPSWCLPSGAEFTTEKSIGQMNLDDPNEFRLRAMFGYTPEGSRALSAADLDAAYVRCAQLARATTPEEADRVCMGAGNLPLEVATARITLGLTAGGKHGSTPLMAALRYYPEKNLDELLKGLIGR